MSQAFTTEDRNGKSVTSDDSNGKSVTSPSTEAQKQQRYRERLREIEALKAEVESLRSDKEAFKVAVREFAQLNEGLKSKLAEIEAERLTLAGQSEAVSIGKEVLADKYLHRIVKEYRREDGPRKTLQRFIKPFMN